MERYATRIDDGTLYVETDDGWIEVGTLDDIFELVGGETYTIEYDRRARAMDWIDAPDGTMTFDVRDVLDDMTYDDAFVEHVEGAPLDEATESGYPRRTAAFADLMTRIWDSKGNLDDWPRADE